MKRLARILRTIADRIDYEGAPKFTGMSYTYELGEGIRVRWDAKGCRLWYLGDADREKAYGDADRPPPQVDWEGLARGVPPYVRPRPFESPAPEDPRAREKGGYSPPRRVYDLGSLPNAPSGPAPGARRRGGNDPDGPDGKGKC